MSFQKSTGNYTNRGFYANGFLNMLRSWMKTSAVSGGAGWTEHDYYGMDVNGNGSTTTFLPAAVNTTNSTITISSHGLFTGQEISFSTSAGGYPSGISVNTVYYTIRMDPDTFKIATTLLNSLSGTNVSITTQGTGTHTLWSIPVCVLRNVPSTPAVNDAVLYTKLWYIPSNTTLSCVNIQNCLSYDITTHIGRGYWCGMGFSTPASGTQLYDFRGGTDFLCIRNNYNSTWGSIIYLLGKFNAVPSLDSIENISKTGTLQSGVTAGNSVTLQLGTSQAANFTVGYGYHIYDFNAHTWVDYVKILARNLGADTVLVDHLNYNFPTGSVIASYPHRFYVLGTHYYDSVNSDNLIAAGSGAYTPIIPYVSVQNFCMHGQSGAINIRAQYDRHAATLTNCNPGNRGYHAAQVPLISEYKRNDASVTYVVDAVGQMADYFYISNLLGLTANVSIRTINSANYLYVCDESKINSSGSGSIGVFIRDTVIA